MSLFISIVAYNDPELLPTIADAYAKAAEPDGLIFGVVDQSDQDHHDTLPHWRHQIRYIWLPARDSRGVCYARSMAQGLSNGEDYHLQIDAHMRFDPGWDEILRRQLQSLQTRSLLTASPMPWDPLHGPRRLKADQAIQLVEHPLHPLRNAANILANPNRAPIPGQRLAAGCLFSPGALLDDVPYDPHLYFNGEEYVYAERVKARGWRIYHPAVLPIYHLYKQAGAQPELLHWSPRSDRPWSPAQLQSSGEARIQAALAGAAGVYSPVERHSPQPSSPV